MNYDIPISDNGGSSSELIRFVGGPSKYSGWCDLQRQPLTRSIGVGDIRSKRSLSGHEGGGLQGIVSSRTNPTFPFQVVSFASSRTTSRTKRTALKTLFEYRLCSDPIKARAEWLRHRRGEASSLDLVSSPKEGADTVRLEYFEPRNCQASPANLCVQLRRGEHREYVPLRVGLALGEAAEPTPLPAGVFMLTAVESARIFSGSFESAIYLLSMICSIPDSVSALPAINSNFTHHISAGLADGTSIAGQVADLASLRADRSSRRHAGDARR